MWRLVLVVCCQSSTATSANWPTYRRDNDRRGATAEYLRLPLASNWTCESPATFRQAFSTAKGFVIEEKLLGDRLSYDEVIDPVVVGSRVYFGSSVDHQLHCVDAQQGQLVWKLRAGPAEEWLLGRGEMISRWSVRTGVMVDGEVAYFGAGIFPHEDVYLYAVNAQDGSIIWKRDNISAADAGRNDLSPQGYLLALDQNDGEAGFGWFAGRQMVVSGDEAYVATGGGDSFYSGNNLEPGANLNFANLTNATFSTGTTLKDGQTVLQRGFDAASLQNYLEASSTLAHAASNLTIVPEPSTVLLLGLDGALLAYAFGRESLAM